MMADNKVYGYDYSGFDKDVVAYISERMDGADVAKMPKEAFKDPSVLVESLMDDSYHGVQAMYPQGMEDPAKAREYIYDNMEEICTVIDMSCGAGKFTEDRFADMIIHDPQQTVLDVYAEEAKALLSETPFYFDKNVCQEQSDERLNKADLEQVRADLEGKPYKREEDVVRFHGVEDGKPFTAEYDYKKMKEKAELYFDRPDRQDVKQSLLAIADKAAREFRVRGPRETFRDFNLSMTMLAKGYKGKNSELMEDLQAWHKYVKSLFKSDQARGLEPKPKAMASLRLNTRENSKEHTFGMAG